MMVIWGRTQDEARAFAQAARIGQGGVIFAGDRSAPSLRGLRPTAVIKVGGAGQGPEGVEVGKTLAMAAHKASKPVPTIDLRGWESPG